MADDRDNRGKGRGKGGSGPRTSVVLTLEKIDKEQKKIEVKATLFNSFQERTLRFIIENVAFSDSIKATKNKSAEYSFGIPENMNTIKVKVEAVDQKNIKDEITISPDLTTPPKKEAPKRLKRLSLDIDDEKAYVLVARLKEDGSPDPGMVQWICNPEDGVTEKATSDTDGTLFIKFTRADHLRRIIIFTPERPGDTIEIDLPRKPEENKKKDEPETPAERRRKLFAQGRNFWKKGAENG